jgi:sugar lactone lactonase YvrE
MAGLKDPSGVKVEIGGVPAELVGASSRTLTVRVPDEAGIGILIRKDSEATAALNVGTLISSEIHAVSNPVVDSTGNVLVTFSGVRGEKVPFSVLMVTPEGEQEPFLAEITNPTAMVIGPDGHLYITSRHTGSTYRSTFDRQLEKHVDGLGLATGIVFDSKDNLLVGDRGGVVNKVSPQGDVSVLCELEPSVSAYHLAIDSEDRLYLSGPTLGTRDSIYAISPDGEIETLFRGFGRPQGLCFDRHGNLQVAASYKGRKGIFSLLGGQPEWSVAGPMLVGLAYNQDFSQLYLVDNSNLYRVDLSEEA